MKLFILCFLLCSTLAYSNLCDADAWVRQDRISRAKYKNISKEISKRFHFVLLCGNGVSTLVEDNEIIWCSKYMIQGHSLTIEELRSIMYSAIQFLWQNVRKEPSFIEYLKYESMFEKKTKRLCPEYFGLRVDLWGENNNRYLYPNLSQVIFKAGKIYYYYADPQTQALQDPIIEELPAWVLAMDGN